MTTGSLISRVARKREVLGHWLLDGIPHDQVRNVPASLNEAREWEDATIHVYSVGAPNSFTRSHPTVGEDVKAIDEFIKKLAKKIARKGGAKPEKRPRAVRVSASELKNALSAMVSQWHMAMEEVRAWRTKCETAEGTLKVVREDLRKQTEELAELRRRISASLNIVK